ncbi:MAG TPA: peptidoglycan DD-metalloendopeptidase family protein [Herpetosiphonaceae bacterium]
MVTEGALYPNIQPGELQGLPLPQPPVKIAIEPQEQGKLVYLRVAPMAEGQASKMMMTFRYSLTNTGTDPLLLHLIKVDVEPALNQSGNPQPVGFSFKRSTTVPPGNPTIEYLSTEENIALPALTWSQVHIQFFFDGYDQPATITLPVAPHASPTPQGSYRFPGNTADMAFDEYFTQKRQHTGASQSFGYDIDVHRWDSKTQGFTRYKSGTSGQSNDNYWAWRKPIYAMADGTVVGFANDQENNPTGYRALWRLAEAEAGGIGALEVISLSSQRQVTAVRTTAGKLRVIVWEVTPDGKAVTRRGHGDGEAMTQVAAVALSATRLVTASRTPAGTLKITIWNVSADGMQVTPLGHVDGGPIDQVTITRMGSSRIATAACTKAGSLSLLIWDISKDGLSISQVGSTQAEAIKKVEITTLMSPDNTQGGRIVTVVQTASNTLKVIVWTLNVAGGMSDRKDVEGEAILDVAVSKLMVARQRVVITVRLTDNTLKAIVWDIAADGTLTRKAETTGDKVRAVTVTRISLNTDTFAAVVVLQSGTLKTIIWQYDETKESLTLMGTGAGGTTDMIASAMLQPGYITTAVRTGVGALKLIIWRVGGGGGNHFYLLHGDELVLYAHMVKGSLNPKLCNLGAKVKQGERLGELGNSGASSGPHLHIHAEKIPVGLTVEQIIQKVQDGSLFSQLAYRPLPFHNARAMQLTDPGDSKKFMVRPVFEADNPFAIVNDQGFYWQTMAIWPGLTTPGIPTGRSEVAIHAVKSVDYQNLFTKMVGAQYRLVWVEGYSVDNDLHFNVIFRPNDGSDWSAHHNLNLAQYDAIHAQHEAQGTQLVHITSYRNGGTTRYAAIFRKDGVSRKSYRDRSLQEHQALLNAWRTAGFVPMQVSVVSVNGQPRFTALYEQRNVGLWVIEPSLTLAQLEASHATQQQNGLRIAYLDAYQHKGGVRFSAIWHQGYLGPVEMHPKLTDAQYQEHDQTNVTAGARTLFTVGYALNGQHIFAGAWRT